MRLEEFFKKYARGRGVGMAYALRAAIRRRISERAPLPPLPAIPLAPPRIRTGRLRNSVQVVPTARGARLVIWAPYAAILEYSTHTTGFPHKFVKPSLEELGISGRNA